MCENHAYYHDHFIEHEECDRDGAVASLPGTPSLDSHSRSSPHPSITETSVEAPPSSRSSCGFGYTGLDHDCREASGSDAIDGAGGAHDSFRSRLRPETTSLSSPHLFSTQMPDTSSPMPGPGCPLPEDSTTMTTASTSSRLHTGIRTVQKTRRSTQVRLVPATDSGASCELPVQIARTGASIGSRYIARQQNRRICHRCRKSFSNERALTRHAHRSACTSAADRIVASCRCICGKSFSRPDSVLRHARTEATKAPELANRHGLHEVNSCCPRR